jgi:hypothetical protein
MTGIRNGGMATPIRTNVKVIVEGQGLTAGETAILQGMVKLLLATIEKQHAVLGEIVDDINKIFGGEDSFGEREISLPHYSPVHEVQEMLKEAFPTITVKIELEMMGRGIPMV